MSNRAIIFSHADADGHVIAVQSKRNLIKAGYDIIDVVVDPVLTRNYKFWEDHFQAADFGDSDHVFIFDIMLNSKNPTSSLEAIANRAISERDRKFSIIDHHPVDLHLELPGNVSLQLVDAVYECCYGEPSELMYLAAICDKEAASVRDRISEWHLKVAKGIHRAVTDRKRIAGRILLELIETGKWQVFTDLADEPDSLHRTIYGNRILESRESPALRRLHSEIAVNAPT